MKTVDVVCGIIIKNKKFLVERRGSNEKLDPGITCLPGGHVDSNENKEDALKREMIEELNIIVKKARFVKKGFWTASNGEKQNIYYYFILDYEGEPSCKEAKELLWIEDVNKLDASIDRKIIKEIKNGEFNL